MSTRRAPARSRNVTTKVEEASDDQPYLTPGDEAELTPKSEEHEGSGDAPDEVQNGHGEDATPVWEERVAKLKSQLKVLTTRLAKE